MTNISVLPLTQKAPFTKGCLLAVNGYLLATFNISDSGLNEWPRDSVMYRQNILISTECLMKIKGQERSCCQEDKSI